MAATGPKHDEFQVVKSRKRGSKGTKVEFKGRNWSASDQEGVCDQHYVMKRIQESRSELESNFISEIKDLLKSIQEHLKYIHSPKIAEESKQRGENEGSDKFGESSVHHLVCYGIGSFSSCLIARYQLAFLLIFRDLLKVHGDVDCSVYDPIFNSCEKKILADLDFKVLEMNEEGKRKSLHQSIYFMPHCGGPLYNNLLWANWSRHLLPNVIIIGNSFSNMLERFPTRIMESEAPFILAIQPYVNEVPLKTILRYHDIFNDTSLHIFPAEKLKTVPSSFWEKPEPVYDKNNVEIILNTI